MRFTIHTLGCQMNVLDSELVKAALIEQGFEPAQRPRDANLVLFNTCSVRQHAEDKVYSALGRLKHLKTRRPEAIIAVIGCMAQKDRDLILRRAPHVDLVLGPGRLDELVDAISAIRAGAPPRVAVSMERDAGTPEDVLQSFVAFDPDRDLRARAVPHQAMVRIMLGCDNFCTYCIVPRVRGPERSRPPREILDELRRLADQGCLEVTLLGQAVNKYEFREAERIWRLADLLQEANAIDGLRRIKFVTNYPRFMDDALIEAVRDLDKVSPYFHVPAQSGSNAVLERMRRRYTREFYLDMLDRIRDRVPEAAITSDFIVGFCGETEAQYEETVDLVRRGRFKNSFIFKYSPRSGTWAADHLVDDVPDDVKRRRNNELLALQNEISWELNRPLAGRHVEVLVEGPSKTSQKGAAGQSGQLTGRTRCDRIVVFDGPPSLTGQIIHVDIESVNSFTLFGRVSEPRTDAGGRSE